MIFSQICEENRRNDNIWNILKSYRIKEKQKVVYKYSYSISLSYLLKQTTIIFTLFGMFQLQIHYNVKIIAFQILFTLALV